MSQLGTIAQKFKQSADIEAAKKLQIDTEIKLKKEAEIARKKAEEENEINIKRLLIILGRSDPQDFDNFYTYRDQIYDIIPDMPNSLNINSDDGQVTINAFDLMILIYYILGVLPSKATIKMKNYIKFNNKRIYSFNKFNISYLLELLRIDKDINDSEQIGIKNILEDLGNLQILNIFKLECSEEEKTSESRVTSDPKLPANQTRKQFLENRLKFIREERMSEIYNRNINTTLESVGRNPVNFIKYRDNVINGYEPNFYSLYCNLNNDDSTKIYFIDLLILIYYILHVEQNVSRKIINRYKKLDDNRLYKLNQEIITNIKELLKIDKYIGDTEITELNYLLGDLQILNLVKEKCIPGIHTGILDNSGIDNELTEGYRIGYPRKGDTNRQTFSQTIGNRGSRYKYLKYKRKYLILKNQINI